MRSGYTEEIWPGPTRYLFKWFPWEFDTWLWVRTWSNLLCSGSQENWWWSSASFLSTNLVAQHFNDSSLLRACEFVHITPVLCINMSGKVWSHCRCKDCCLLLLSSLLSHVFLNLRVLHKMPWRHMLGGTCCLWEWQTKVIPFMVQGVFSSNRKTACSSICVQMKEEQVHVRPRNRYRLKVACGQVSSKSKALRFIPKITDWELAGVTPKRKFFAKSTPFIFLDPLRNQLLCSLRYVYLFPGVSE